MTWASFVGAAAVTLALFVLLGVPLARALGVRGFAQIALAPVFATTVVCGASIVLPWLGVGWSLVGVAVLAVLIGVALYAMRRALRRYTPSPSPRRRADPWLVLALGVAAAIILARFVAILGAPDAISQTFDNVFHLNAVRWVLDTGSASSLQIGYMTNPDGPAPFYPAGWHGFVALVAQLSGASVPVAINAFVGVVSAVVWPLGAVYLARTLFGRSRTLVVSAALLATAVPTYPYLLIDYGVLYPFHFGVALLPATLAITAHLLGVSFGRDRLGMGWWVVALLGALPGLALSHPGAFMGWVALSAPLVLVFVVGRWRAASLQGRMWIAIATLGYLVLGVLLVRALRPPAEARGWPPQMSVPEAVADLIAVAPWYGVASIVVALTVASGIVWAGIRRTAPAWVSLGIYVVVGVLFVMVAAVPFPLRDIFTAPWYNNTPRIAALVTIALVPLGAYGVACTVAAMRRRLGAGRWPKAVRVAASGAGAVAFAVALQAGPLSAMPAVQTIIPNVYASTPASPLLSTDEATLIGRLDEHVPEGAAIAGSPWTGTSVAYALTGHRTLMPHVQMTLSEEIETVNSGLRNASAGDPVCAAAADLGVQFVLDFGGREIHDGQHEYPGLEDLETSDAVRLVDSEGDARLYEVTACTP